MTTYTGVLIANTAGHDAHRELLVLLAARNTPPASPAVA